MMDLPKLRHSKPNCTAAKIRESSFFLVLIAGIERKVFIKKEDLGLTAWMNGLVWVFRNKVPFHATPIVPLDFVSVVTVALFNSLSTKKADPKFSFRKTLSRTYIILRIQRLEGKQYRSRWGCSLWATSLSSMLFANSAIFVSGT